MGWKAFPPSWYQDIKAKQFSIPFKRKRVARKIKELKRKLFCFARRSSAGGNAGAGFQIIRAIFAQKRFELRSAIATGNKNKRQKMAFVFVIACQAGESNRFGFAEYVLPNFLTSRRALHMSGLKFGVEAE